MCIMKYVKNQLCDMSHYRLTRTRCPIVLKNKYAYAYLRSVEKFRLSNTLMVKKSQLATNWLQLRLCLCQRATDSEDS